MKNTILLASLLMATGFLVFLTLSSPLTTNAEKVTEDYEDNAKYEEKLNTDNKDSMPKSCEESFLSKNEGGPISQDLLSDLNTYLSQNPVAVGDEPPTDVKNVDGLCVLIKLIESENTEGKLANEEQVRNILNAALQEKSNLPEIDGIIDSLLDQNLIQLSDD